jgi:subtilisin family serine protease
MKKFFLLSLFIISCLSANIAQKLTYVQGELLIQPMPGVKLQQWTKEWQVFNNVATQFTVQEQVSEPLNVWRCTFDFTKIDQYKLLAAIRQDKNIAIAQFNHLVESRSTVPNDPQFELQWYHFNVGQSGGTPGEDLDSDLAWDITTGGVTPTGDTIVVCIIDDGLSTAHPDFGNNIWVNHREIPNNGKDDDNNGYIDDYRGWNILRGNDLIDNRTVHGTPIAGIIGAKGNNNIGVAGVNWNVKLMIVAGVPETEAQALTAYSYPLTMRRRYNTSGGTQGAFVVATNSSWGTPFAFARDAPLWCAMYDSLGTHGILNAAATANANINVEERGDLPTTCPSDFLIGVTNIDKQGNLFADAGFGTTSVDLAAYGDNVWTTRSPTEYGTFTGTSYATPQVAGAIALLYSAPCRNFASLYKSDPKAAALFARQFILQGVNRSGALANFTVTGGKLNLYNALQQLTAACTECFPPTSIAATNLTDKAATLTWVKNAEISRTDLRWRAVGAATWTEILNANSPVTLNNLMACKDYEFQLKHYCTGTAQEYSKSVVFKTDGCCTAPANPKVTFIGATIGNFSWNKVTAATGYTLRLRGKGTTAWQTYNAANTTLLVNNLTTCTEYEAQLASRCSGTLSEFGTLFSFRTPNCGACRDLEYCIPNNLDASGEWIASVKIGTLNNVSGSNEGYGDFTGNPPTKLTLGKNYDLELKPGFAALPYTEYFIVWIDFNQDGSFVSSEVIYQKGSSANAFIGVVSIPTTAKLGITRMRVAMQFLNPGGPCTFNGTGGAEVEDYCVEIVQVTDVEKVTQEATLQVFPNPFEEQLLVQLDFIQLQKQAVLEIVNLVGQVVQTKSLGTLLPGSQTIPFDTKNLPAGLYLIRYRNEAGAMVTKKIIKQ